MVEATTVKPLVSICIANYNGLAIIASCLESVFAQQGDIPFEIIVHDDASTDDSVEYLRKQYEDIELIESKINVGFCIANNRMAAAAKGEYLLLLNNDATLFPDAIASLLASAQKNYSPAILGLPQYDANTGELLDMGSMLDPFLNPIPNLNPTQNEVGMIMGACLWIPKKLWLELGGFPEWFSSIGEDLYLCCRARLAGYKILALNHSGYHHCVGHSFGGGKVLRGKLETSLRRRALSERNKTFVMTICYPSPFFQFLLPIHLVLLLMEGLILTLARFNLSLMRLVYVECLRSLWHKRNLLYQLRKEVQMSKQIGSRKFFSAIGFVPHKLTLLFKHGLPIIRN